MGPGGSMGFVAALISAGIFMNVLICVGCHLLVLYRFRKLAEH
jgi:hypothetical protein